MVAHTVFFRQEYYGIAAHRPKRTVIGISRPGKMRELSTLYIDYGDIGVRTVMIVVNLQRNPFAVGRPLEIKSAVAVAVGRAVSELLHLLALSVHHHELVAVLHKCELLAVRRKFGHRALRVVSGNHRLLVYQRRV